MKIAGNPARIKVLQTILQQDCRRRATLSR